MQTFEGVEKLTQDFKSSVLTIGNFDGIHLGHQALIEAVLENAKKYDAPSVVMTFEPHPHKILFPERNLKRIFAHSDQQNTIAKYQVDYYIKQAFSRDLSSLSPERFFLDYIFKPFNPKVLVVGYDFSFGANREGSIEYLKKLSASYGFELIVIPPIRVEGEIVSSSLIRRSLENGQVEKVKALLGRPFYLEGVVEKGKSRGKSIGFPTANIYSTNEIYPANGVYACHVHYQNKKYTGVTNIGKNPTFEEATKRDVQVECHILEFDQDIYGEDLKIEFLEHIREEKKFSGVEELVAQISKDVDYVKRKYL
tara:strand:- start:5346 stop:6275 length:930 start_codon:yes stop_codon:yes gene_type:complete